MWQIVKASLTYYSLMILIYMILLTGAMVFQFFFSDELNIAVGNSMANVMPFIMISLFIKEKWERFVSLLPVSRLRLAFVRMIVIILPIVLLYGYYYLLLIIFRRPGLNYEIGQFVLMVGVFTGLYLMTLIGRDIFCSVATRFRIFLICTGGFLSGAFIAGMIYLIVKGFQLLQRGESFMISFIFCILFFMLISLVGLNLLSFNKRKSFL